MTFRAACIHVHLTLTKLQIEDKNPILMATNLKEVSMGLWQEVILSEIEANLSTS